MTYAYIIISRIIRTGGEACGLLCALGPGCNDDLRALACWRLRLLRFERGW